MNIPETLPTTSADKHKLLEKIADHIAKGRPIETDEIEHCVFLRIEFDGSPEGLSIAIENAEMIGAEGIAPDQYFMLNYWVYESMPKEEQDSMYLAIQRALELIPDIVITQSDDPFDLNPNSAVPEFYKSYNHYHSKTNDPNFLKECFDFDN